ncbi:hypothetical protein G7Y89_g6188 [Cudoniella acicularis]|uniref:Uncharacterized protein n=1 Tax=Cudoniella acicularis TaxID=354080 RepID=A0A8H4W2P4_9HELO|nr:hypothetical protein G7Y89_g6188 [Cudoniella acicularis]
MGFWSRDSSKDPSAKKVSKSKNNRDSKQLGQITLSGSDRAGHSFDTKTSTRPHQPQGVEDIHPNQYRNNDGEDIDSFSARASEPLSQASGTRSNVNRELPPEILDQDWDEDSRPRNEAPRPPLKTLRKAYADFASQRSFREQCGPVVYYVQELESDYEQYRHAQQAADDTLQMFCSRIVSLIENLQPTESHGLRRQNPSWILDFMLKGYESTWRNQGKLADMVQAGQNREETLQTHLDDANASLYNLGQNLEEQKRLKGQMEIEHERLMNAKQMKYEAALRKHEAEAAAALKTEQDKHVIETSQLNASWQSRKDRLDENIRRLQISLIAPMDDFQLLADDKAQNRLEDLRAAVRTLARTATEGMDSERLGDVFGQSEFVRFGKKTGRKYILESLLWSIVARGLFSNPFTVFGELGKHFTLTWTRLYEATGNLESLGFSWPNPTRLSENWRYATSEALRKGLMQPNPDKYIVESHSNQLSEVTQTLMDTISKVTTKSKTNEIEAVVSRASALAIDLSIQRSRMQLYAPPPDEVLPARGQDTYEILNAEADVGGGKVQFAVMPGLKKTGDAKGGFLETTTVLRPAAVYLRTW